jgi:acetoin utilization deacetylase AcuC-like enzyme
MGHEINNPDVKQKNRMNTIYTWIDSPTHLYPGHPEHPSRLQRLKERLPAFGARELPFQKATPQEVMRVHSGSLLRELEQACRVAPQIIDYAPTYVTPSSLEDAFNAAGAALTALRAILQQQATNGFAIIRPPGHHAEPQRAMGFCLFNNVAIAAREALSQGLERVLIVDIDAHHGNGTQAAFREEPRVAYFSTHQWGIYPGTGWLEDAPQARQRIVNVPLPAFSGDTVYLRAFEECLEAQVNRFQPQLFLISIGFDAHWRDPLTELGLTLQGYFRLAQRLVELAEHWCEGRILFVLEGGYDPHIIAEGGLAVLAALAHHPWTPPPETPPAAEPEIEDLLQRIRGWHGF